MRKAKTILERASWDTKNSGALPDAILEVCLDNRMLIEKLMKEVREIGKRK